MWLNRALASSAVVCLACLAQAQTAPDERKIWNDVYTRLTAQNEPFRPNPFLTRILDGKTPGNAIDIGMGQGRRPDAGRAWLASHRV